jgi:glucose/arabinose dehydrogenase
MSLVGVVRAIAKAMFNMTGKRLCRLPNLPEEPLSQSRQPKTKEVRMQGYQTVLLASAIGMLGIPDAVAQQGGGERPSWALERPEQSPAAEQLAPVSPPPIPTAREELPLDAITLPEGFEVELFASGLANARSLALGEDGTVFVGTRLVGRVYAIINENGETEVSTIAQGLTRPNGVAYKDGALYVAEVSRVLRYDDIQNRLDDPPEPAVVYDDLPKDEPHGWKFIAIGPDNKLYVPVGAPCNICEPPEEYAQIRRVNLDGSGAEVIARGVRNTVGFDWHPESGELWFTENGRDWLSESIPHDELNRATGSGEEHFGYPYCHQGNILDDQFGWGRDCADYKAPAALLGPHTAALGAEFYEGTMFPEEYRNQLFIARHGPWNRTTKDEGGDVVVAKLDDQGKVVAVEPFMTGLLQNNEYLGRPVDLEVLPDGSLLVSDDFNGAIYRVTYRG